MKPRIVIAWYSDSFLKEIGGHLERMGYEVITFNDGGETLHYLRENTVDAVMLGVVMPTLDGFEVTGAIIKEAILPFQKIILLTYPFADAPTPRMSLIHGVPFAFWEPIRDMRENLPDDFDWNNSGILMVTPIPNWRFAHSSRTYSSDWFVNVKARVKTVLTPVVSSPAIPSVRKAASTSTPTPETTQSIGLILPVSIGLSSDGVRLIGMEQECVSGRRL